ncbi:hypothetical protein B0X71_08070 [Planococcus lenghuensis]|uniref:Uncharacterized protein n=1 Tax=Planococcus lenghuensis TaxID=2213202 RepID=A0A1Q2KY28_9BACL|nr:hypothetical protein B0X71_08070 [Planococcus lenghuensis]
MNAQKAAKQLPSVFLSFAFLSGAAKNRTCQLHGIRINQAFLLRRRERTVYNRIGIFAASCRFHSIKSQKRLHSQRRKTEW